MKIIKCNINTIDFYVEYNKTVRKNNVYYWGRLFTNKPLSFSFTQKNGKVLFTPLNTEPFVVDALTKSIQEHERRLISHKLV